MAIITTGSIQLPNKMAAGIISKIREQSVIARLAPATAGTSLLNDQYNLITTEPELEFVGESGAKAETDFAVTPKITGRYKAVGTIRFSDEVLLASDEEQIGLLEGATDAMAAAGARALDYGIFHAKSPKSGGAITGATSLVSGATAVTATADPTADMDGMPDAIIAAGYNVTGVGLAPTFANQLRKVRSDSGAKVFPDLPLDVTADADVDGIRAAISSTVNGARITPATGIKAIMGDYSLVKWGIVREIRAKLIEAGDPDNAGRDLAGHNEVALRYEVIYKWVVLDPQGFSVLS